MLFYGCLILTGKPIGKLEYDFRHTLTADSQNLLFEKSVHFYSISCPNDVNVGFSQSYLSIQID